MFKMIKDLKLSNKLILVFLLPMVVLIAIGGYFSYSISKKRLEEQVLASLGLLVRTKKDYLETFLDFNKGRVADWSSDGYIRDSFEKITEDKDDAKIKELSTYIKTKKQVLDPEIKITDIIDMEGVIVVSTISERVGMKETIDDLNKEYNFTKAKNALFGGVFVSSIVTEDEPGHSMNTPMWHVSTPVVSLKTDMVIGVIVNHISNDKLIEVFKKNQQSAIDSGASEASSLLGQGSTLEIYLVDSRKLMLTPSLFVKNAILNQTVDTEPVRKCYEAGESMNGVYDDYRGISVFGASACVDDDSHWTLLTEIDKSETTRELNDIKIIIMGLSIGTLLGSLILVYFLDKIIVFPIKELSGSIKKMTKGQLLQRLEVSSADEVGDLIESFNEMSGRIEEEDRAKSEFVSLASHQLLTPLTTIRWLVEVLQGAGGDDLTDQQKKNLRDIGRIDYGMIDLVRALLDVSRIELGTFFIEPEQVSLDDLVESVLEELVPKIKEKKIEIIKKYEKAATNINMDPKLTRIIFQNILTNAVKYTPNEGKIVIGISREDSKILISFADTGYGIPKEFHPKVFSKFFRGDNIKEKNPEGTGLGLYMVRSIVEHSGGKIWFESEENKGTTFYVSFPLEGMIKKEGTKQLGA